MSYYKDDIQKFCSFSKNSDIDIIKRVYDTAPQRDVANLPSVFWAKKLELFTHIQITWDSRVTAVEDHRKMGDNFWVWEFQPAILSRHEMQK